MKTITDKYIRSLFNSISSELTELVQEAEKMPYTTKNNYGQYLKLLTMLKPLSGLDNAVKLLILAGGNKQGILDAKEILK
jgi:hypothetical protein